MNINPINNTQNKTSRATSKKIIPAVMLIIASSFFTIGLPTSAAEGTDVGFTDFE